MMLNEKSKNIFKFVERYDLNMVKCIFCKKQLKLPLCSNEYSNIYKHRCIRSIRLEENADTNESTQSTINILPKFKKEKIDTALLKVIVEDFRPLNTAQTPAFRNFINTLNPNYKPPDKKTISK